MADSPGLSAISDETSIEMLGLRQGVRNSLANAGPRLNGFNHGVRTVADLRKVTPRDLLQRNFGKKARAHLMKVCAQHGIELDASWNPPPPRAPLLPGRVALAACLRKVTAKLRLYMVNADDDDQEMLEHAGVLEAEALLKRIDGGG